MKSSLIALLAVATAGMFALAACGDPSVEPATSPTDQGSTTIDTNPSTTPATTQAPSDDLAALLAGKTYLSQTTTGITLAPDAVLRISFEDGRISVSGGCNGMGGDVTFEGDAMTVGPMMSTQMACDQSLMDQDSAVQAFLTAGTTVSVDGDTLTLTGGEATITLLDREVADPDRPLADTAWTVTGVISSDAISSGWGSAVASLTIVDGQAQVNTGCNRGVATVTVDEAAGTIAFGPLALTKMMCDDDAMRLEQEISRVLTGTATYSIEAGSLTLMNGTDGLQLTDSTLVAG
ncbi:MAG: META domain-containing protein [Actinomycetota bacterium]